MITLITALQCPVIARYYPGLKRHSDATVMIQYPFSKAKSCYSGTRCAYHIILISQYHSFIAVNKLSRRHASLRKRRWGRTAVQDVENASFPCFLWSCDCGRIEIEHLYGLRCRGWYCNPAQHSSYVFRLKFHWILFPGVPLTIFQHWFR